MGKETTTNFSTIGANKFCFICNSLAVKLHCTAVKCIEYNKAAQLLEVFHLSKHTCEAKPLQKDEDDKFLQENIRKFGTILGPKELAKVKMSEKLRNQMSTGKYDMTKIVGHSFQIHRL